MQQEYPSLVARMQSTFIDLLFVIALMFAFSAILDHYANVPDWIPVLLFIGIWVVYEPLCTSMGATLGNYFKGIRVRQEQDPTKRINFFAALLRYVVKVLLGWVSFLTIGNNPERRAIHDFAAGSVMIKR